MSDQPMIRKLEIYQDPEPMRAAVETVTPLLGTDNVISVTSRPGTEQPLHDHIGWLPEGLREGDFTVINPEFRGTAIHWDTSLRYHYAVVTNPACYLVHLDGEQGRFHHIPADGHLYEMDARLTHTAINVSRHARIHLVICDARDEGLKDGRPAEHAELLPSR